MKLPQFKKILNEIVPGATTGVPGASSWTISAQDLAKKAQDPSFIAKLKTHVPQPGADLAKIVADFVSPIMLQGVSDEVYGGFIKRLKQILDTKRYQASRMRPKEPAAATVSGRPTSPETQPAIPSQRPAAPKL